LSESQKAPGKGVRVEKATPSEIFIQKNGLDYGVLAFALFSTGFFRYPYVLIQNHTFCPVLKLCRYGDNSYTTLIPEIPSMSTDHLCPTFKP
jgi:hypothetical protein